jgi:hypothetical protein
MLPSAQLGFERYRRNYGRSDMGNVSAILTEILLLIATVKILGSEY